MFRLAYKYHIEPYGNPLSITLCGSMRKHLDLFHEIATICDREDMDLKLLSPKLGKKISDTDGFVRTEHDDPTLTHLQVEYGHLDCIKKSNPSGVVGKSAFLEAIFTDYHQKKVFFLHKPADDEEILIKDIYEKNQAHYQRYLDMHTSLIDKLWELKRVLRNLLKDPPRTLASD